MSGFLPSGGSAASDRGTQLSGQQDQWTNLREARSRYDQLYPGAQQLFQGAQANLGQGADYFKNILGNRPAALAAVAPETNAVNQQADAARTAQANLGTARSGGMAAPAQQAEQMRSKAINDAIFGARPQAAQQVAQIGAQQGQLSQEQMSNALRSLGLSSDIADQLVRNAMQSRQISAGIRSADISQIGQMVGGMMLGPVGGAVGGMMGGGGLSPGMINPGGGYQNVPGNMFPSSGATGF